MKVLFSLFLSFFKTGLMTFGGGYAMLPILRDELVAKKGWLDEDELLNYFSIGSCTPGIIAVNVATFCGYKLKKNIGAFVATLGVILPSFIIIGAAFSVLGQMLHHPNTAHILNGIKIGVLAVLIKVVYDFGLKIYRTSQNKIWPALIFVVAITGLILLHISSALIIALALIIGVFCLLKTKIKKVAK